MNDKENEAPGAPSKTKYDILAVAIQKFLDEALQGSDISYVWDRSNLKPNQFVDDKGVLMVCKIAKFTDLVTARSERNKYALVVSPPQSIAGEDQGELRRGHYVYNMNRKLVFLDVKPKHLDKVFVDRGYSIKEILPWDVTKPMPRKTLVTDIKFPYIRDANNNVWDIRACKTLTSFEGSIRDKVVHISKIKQRPGGDLFVRLDDVDYQIRQEKVGEFMTMRELEKASWYGQPLHAYQESDDVLIRVIMKSRGDEVSLRSNDRAIQQEFAYEAQLYELLKLSRIRLYHFDHNGDVTFVGEMPIFSRSSVARRLKSDFDSVASNDTSQS